MTDAEVSVVVPTRDRPAFLARAVSIALQQERVEVELIVVDDGSRDDTRTLIASLEDARVRVVTHPSSVGVARSRNDGIAAATAPWVAFLDDDDVWAPVKLRTQLDRLAATGTDFVYSSAVDVSEDGTIGRCDRAPAPDRLVPGLLEQNLIPAGSSNVLASTRLVREVGGFDEGLSHAADWDLWIRLAFAARAAACDGILVAYTLHAANMLVTDAKRVGHEFSYVAAKHRGVAERHGVRVDRSAYYRWVADGHRRAGRRAMAARSYLRAAISKPNARDALRAGAAIGGLRGERPAWAAGRRHQRGHAPPDWLRRYVGQEPTRGSA